MDKRENVALNVERSDSLDGLAYDEKTKTVKILLADGMDWSDEYNHLVLLQEKLNNYLWFIESKQYKEHFPDSENVLICVTFLFKEGENCLKLLSIFKQMIEESFKNVILTVEHGTEDTF